MGEHDRDPYGVKVAVMLSSAVEAEWPWFARPDSDDCAPAWATDFDRSHPYALACISRRGDDSHDLPWDEVAYDMDRCGQFCEVLRPSPGDDITRAAFDELDRER